MRYPAEETAKKHERILAEASKLFRERGFDGVSVAEIMKATGLTHGPFYNHFASKEALMADSIAHASASTGVGLDAVLDDPEALRAYVQDYLSPGHRDCPGEGCVLAALSGEARNQPAVRAPFSTHLKASIDKFARHFPWKKKSDTRVEAIRALSAMVGAVALARAVDDAELSDEILAAVRSAYERPAE